MVIKKPNVKLNAKLTAHDIIMRCGYDGCEWGIRIPRDMIYEELMIDENSYPNGYLIHVMSVHVKIPPVRWERDKESEF